MPKGSRDQLDHYADDAAAAGDEQARIMRVVDVSMRAILGLPFRQPISANLMLVSYTGVKSGKACPAAGELRARRRETFTDSWRRQVDAQPRGRQDGHPAGARP